MSAVAVTGRQWSSLQEDIFSAVKSLQPAQHLVVEALAGTGKSTTIEECVEITPPSSRVLVCAFNKSIAEAMAARLPSDVEVRTLHSLGAGIVRSAMGHRVVDQYYVEKASKKLLGFEWSRREARTACSKLVGLAKGYLCEAEPEELDALADSYGLEINAHDRDRVVHAAARLLEQCAENSEGPIDFDDQIWLPHVLDLPAPTWDFVFVDETQDLNAAQLSLAQRVAGTNGRIIAVGDRRQAIYGFRGADREAIPRMIRELKAKTLPLSITYRCPVSVVREANAIVPELQPRPGAPEGIVKQSTVEQLRKDAQPGDMVLSRVNAPLISLCYRWLAEGRRAMIQGRNIGQGLASWITNCHAVSVPQLCGAVNEWCTKEVARLAAAERDTQSTIDKAECLIALAEGCSTVEDVIAKCERLFGEAKSSEGCILLSSTHRAKGLEADRVWVLRDTYLRWPGVEEKNLLYVAITRAKRELIYVRKGAE